MTAAHPLRRSDEDRKTQSAGALELFYDLVFVFAITQVSHHLLEHLTWEGAGQSALMLLMVWWSWNYTTWLTNELNADTVAVRLAVILLMLGSLLMAIAIPDAFGDKALLFAGAYVVIQVGRSAFLTFAGAHAGLARAHAGQPDPDLVHRVGRVLDRGRAGRGLDPDPALADRARHRLRRPRRDLPRPGPRPGCRSAPGTSAPPTSPSGSSCS